MKRRLFKLCLFMLLGAIINVAVAWDGAAFSEVPQLMSDMDKADAWPTAVPSHWPGAPGVHGARTSMWSIVNWSASRDTFDAGYRSGRMERFDIQRRECGWPARALQSEKWSEWFMDITLAPAARFKGEVDIVEPDYDAHRTIREDGHPAPTVWMGGIPVHTGLEVLPVKPIWPGFAINTIFYAAIIWLPFGAFELRRRRRIKRGLCPACAYPIRGGTSDVCTECGRMVPR